MHQERQWRKLQKRGAKTLRGALAGGMVGPAGATWQPPSPLLLRVSSPSLLNLPATFLVADKFHVYFALDSLFSSFLKFTLENTKYKKIVEIVR